MRGVDALGKPSWHGICIVAKDLRHDGSFLKLIRSNVQIYEGKIRGQSPPQYDPNIISTSPKGDKFRLEIGLAYLHDHFSTQEGTEGS